MVLETIEVMDYIYEFNKFLKSYFDDKTKQLMQGFKLMASQLRGKPEVGGSTSFHHGETHKTIHFEDFDDWLNGYRHNKENVSSLRDNQQFTSLEEHEMRKNQPTCEKSLDTPLKEETENHEVENKLPL